MKIESILEQIDAVSLTGTKNTEQHDAVFYEIVDPIMRNIENNKEKTNLIKLLDVLLKETFDKSKYSQKQIEHLRHCMKREKGKPKEFELIDFRLRFNVNRFWFAVELCFYYIAIFEDRYNNERVPYTKSMKKIKNIYCKSMNPQKATMIKQNCLSVQKDFYEANK